jgi:hypothetical protein
VTLDGARRLGAARRERTGGNRDEREGHSAHPGDRPDLRHVPLVDRPDRTRSARGTVRIPKADSTYVTCP